MANERDKQRSRRNRAEVRRVLMAQWDPIGVAGVAAAADEYDGYASRAYVMLVDENASGAAIADYLLTVATERMGLAATPALRLRCANAAAALLEMRPEFLR